MIAHLIENYFIGISLAELQLLMKTGETEFDGNQHYSEHLLAVAKSMIGPGVRSINDPIAAHFDEGMPLYRHEADALLLREGLIGIFRNGRPWLEPAIKSMMLPGQENDRYLNAAAHLTANVFSRIKQGCEGLLDPVDAEILLGEIKANMPYANYPNDAEVAAVTKKIVATAAEFFEGRLFLEEAIRLLAAIGGPEVAPLRSILNGIMIGFLKDDAVVAVTTAAYTAPNDFATSALAAAFSATSRVRRPGMTQLLKAKSIFAGVDDANKQYEERKGHLKLVVDSIEFRRAQYGIWETRG